MSFLFQEADLFADKLESGQYIAQLNAVFYIKNPVWARFPGDSGV